MDDGANIMAEYQWLVMPAVAIVAVIVTFYLGKKNLRNIVAQQERESGRADGRIEVKLENLEQAVGVVKDDLRLVKEKLDGHDVLLRQLCGEAKKQSRRLRKLRRRVDALESDDPTMPPTEPPTGAANVIKGPRPVGSV